MKCVRRLENARGSLCWMESRLGAEAHPTRPHESLESGRQMILMLQHLSALDSDYISMVYCKFGSRFHGKYCLSDATAGLERTEQTNTNPPFVAKHYYRRGSEADARHETNETAGYRLIFIRGWLAEPSGPVPPPRRHCESRTHRTESRRRSRVDQRDRRPFQHLWREGCKYARYAHKDGDA